MSELIDRIVDLDAISGQVLTTLAEMKKIESAIQKLNESTKTIMSDTRASKGVEDLSKNAKSLNDNVVLGEKEMKRWQATVQSLQQQTEKLNTLS